MTKSIKNIIMRDVKKYENLAKYSEDKEIKKLYREIANYLRNLTETR